MFSMIPNPEQTRSDEFNEVLRRYGDMAYRMAYQITGGREADARDLVQECFLRIWHQWSLMRPSSMEGWTYRVLRNLYVDAVRRRNRQATQSLDFTGADESWEELLPDGRPSIQNQLEREELQKQIADALARLNEDYRLPVVLCDMECLTYEEIGRILGCPVGTVRSRIHRGRLHLRSFLEPLKSMEAAS